MKFGTHDYTARPSRRRNAGACSRKDDENIERLHRTRMASSRPRTGIDNLNSVGHDRVSYIFFSRIRARRVCNTGPCPLGEISLRVCRKWKHENNIRYVRAAGFDICPFICAGLCFRAADEVDFGFTITIIRCRPDE